MRAVLRVGLWLLALVELALGAWTLASPASFYLLVPTVDLTPPYSEHLFRDFGGATLGLAIVLGAAALWPSFRLVIVALLAYLAFSVPHFLFHLSHLEGASSLEAAVLVGTLAGSVALPVGLLVTQLALGRDQADGRPVKSSID